MTAHRPDILPLGVPTRMGVPYHGLVTSGALACPDSTTKTYAQPSGGDTVLVQHPRHSVPAADPDTQRSWQEYTLLSGVNRQIGGQDLGANRWIYCDANYAWAVRVAFGYTKPSLTISVYLVSPFGIFPAIAMTERLLAQATFTVLTIDGNPQTSTYSRVERLITTHDKTGAITICNAMTPDYSPYKLYAIFANCCYSVKILLSGNGSIEVGKVGDGISATLSTQWDAQAGFSDTVVDTGTPTPGTIYYTWQTIPDIINVTDSSVLVGDCESDCTRTSIYHKEFYQEWAGSGSVARSDSAIVSHDIVKTYFPFVLPDGTISEIRETLFTSAAAAATRDVSGPGVFQTVVNRTLLVAPGEFEYSGTASGYTWAETEVQYDNIRNTNLYVNGALVVTAAFTNTKYYNRYDQQNPGCDPMPDPSEGIVCAPDHDYDGSYITDTDTDTGVSVEIDEVTVVASNIFKIRYNGTQIKYASFFGDDITSSVTGAYVSLHPETKQVASGSAPVCWV